MLYFIIENSCPPSFGSDLSLLRWHFIFFEIFFSRSFRSHEKCTTDAIWPMPYKWNDLPYARHILFSVLLVNSRKIISYVQRFKIKWWKKLTEDSSKMTQKKPKLFQAIKRNLAILKFKPNQSDSMLMLLRDHWVYFFESILALTLFFVYLIHVAETIDEFMFVVFWITASLVIFLCFISTVLKTSVLFKFLNDAETIYSNSE